MGRPVCLLEAPGPPREARPPEVAQRHSKETVWVVWGCLLEVSGPLLGSLRAPKATPKSLQGRGRYEASDPKLTQTKASELKLHSFPTRPLVFESRGGTREAKTIEPPIFRDRSLLCGLDAGGSVPRRPGNAKSAQMTFSPRLRACFQICVFLQLFVVF